VLLLVARTESIHTTRWVAQILDPTWKVLVFPSSAAERIHPQLDRAVVLRSPPARLRDLMLRWGLHGLADLFDKAKDRLELAFPGYRIGRLRRAIGKHRPALIHSMEMQVSGYLTLEATKGFDRGSPPWLMTIWGSDIFLYDRLQAHRQRVRRVLARCDFFSCECVRDIEAARKLGFAGKTLPPGPAAGGFDLMRLRPLRARSTASRRQIMLKGYQGVTGRALVGLRALERCIDLLGGYTVVVYSAAPEVVVAAELLSEKTGIATRIVPTGSSHDHILEMHGMARISIGLSISDGACASMQEAMVMGSFPIQSETACASEWLDDGISGMIVPPEDPDVVERALRIALTDDELVNKAAEANWKLAQARLEKGLLSRRAIDGYRELLSIPAARLAEATRRQGGPRPT
jgi:glycosyl transferase family 1/glycosyl transferase family 4